MHNKRVKKIKIFRLDFLTFVLKNEHKTISETLSAPKTPLWKKPINSEIDSIMQNNTWELVDLPLGITFRV